MYSILSWYSQADQAEMLSQFMGERDFGEEAEMLRALMIYV